MNEVSESWYSITDWGRQYERTTDKKEVRLALREGCEVFKTTRQAFRSGDSEVYLTVITEIKKVKDI